jgi:beta-1,4-mannosyl-glycoprotein beta-1,4-N-acetylglucosaminyltransferase
LEIVKLLIENANINDKNNNKNALYYTIINKHIEIAKLLIDNDSDYFLDEIPDKNMFGLIMDELKTTDILALVHRFFYYNLNCMFDGPWFGPMVTKKHILDHTSPQKVREHAIAAKRIQYGGWHLSYFFGENAIKTKLQSFAHQEWNQDYWLNPERIKKCIEEKKDIFERENHPPLIEPPLEIFPEDFLKVFRQYRRTF